MCHFLVTAITIVSSSASNIGKIATSYVIPCRKFLVLFYGLFWVVRKGGWFCLICRLLLCHRSPLAVFFSLLYYKAFTSVIPKQQTGLYAPLCQVLFFFCLESYSLYMVVIKTACWEKGNGQMWSFQFAVFTGHEMWADIHICCTFNLLWKCCFFIGEIHD